MIKYSWALIIWLLQALEDLCLSHLGKSEQHLRMKQKYGLQFQQPA